MDPNIFVYLLMHTLLWGYCNTQATVKSHTKAPYCGGYPEEVTSALSELSQKVSQLEQDLQTEKEERDLLQQKFERETQRLDAFTSKKSSFRMAITYTVENLVYGTNFEATVSFYTPQTFFIIIMKQAIDMNPVFNFTSTEHPRYGEYVTSINGLYTNNDAHLYWALIRRFEVNNEDCLINVGISFYVPETSEHVVLQYRSWDNHLPSCDGGHVK